MIAPGTAHLAFTIVLTLTYANRTVVENLGRAVVKKTMIKISGNEVMSIDDSDVYYCYNDLWKTNSERQNAAYQGIDEGTTSNMLKLWAGAGDGIETNVQDKAIAVAYATGSMCHSTSSCLRATWLSTRAPWVTDWNMS